MTKINSTEEIVGDGEISLDNLDALIEGDLNLEDIKSIEKKKTEEIIEKPPIDEEGDLSFIGKKKTEEIIEKPPIDESFVETQVEENTSFHSRAKYLIDEGFIEDIRISVSEDEEDEGIPLSEFKDLTEEQLGKILEASKVKREDSRANKYISKDNLSENQLKVVDIMKNGGDIKELFKNPEDIIRRPFEDMDLEVEDNQRRIIVHHYMNDKGLSQKEAFLQLKQKDADFETEDFSKEILGLYNKAYDKYLDNVKREKKEQTDKVKLDLLEKRKSFSSSLKEQKIKESLVKKLVDGVTKKDNGLVAAQRRLEEILSKPDENYEILLHLLDEKAYKEINNIKSNKKLTSEVFRMVDSMPKRTSKREKKEDTNTNLSDFEKDIMKI